MGQNHSLTAKRVALFGGTFDPVTDAHLMVAAEVIHAAKADEVWMVPTTPTHRQCVAGPLDRWMMVTMAVDATFGSKFPVRVVDYDVVEQANKGAYQHVVWLQQRFPNFRFSVVIGSNLLEQAQNWRSPNGETSLWTKCKCIVSERPGYPIPDPLPSNFVKLEAPGAKSNDSVCLPFFRPPPPRNNIVVTDLSTSQLRHRIKLYGPMATEGMIPPVVLAHIIRNGLYPVGELQEQEEEDEREADAVVQENGHAVEPEVW